MSVEARGYGHATRIEQIRVLHVDDDPGLLDLTADLLERESDQFEVVTETSASDGLDRLADECVDCIVSDYDMPRMDGVEFLEAVREEYPDLPFILFTGKGSEEVASDAFSAGATDYLQKESGTDQYTVLANSVENAVEKARAKTRQNRYLGIIENVQEGINIIDSDGNIIFANETIAEFHNCEPEDLLGRHWEELYPDDEVSSLRTEAFPIVEEEGYWQGRTKSRRADGSTFTVDHTIAQTDTGEIVCSMRDLSEQEERERELTRYRRLIDAMGDPVYTLDPDGCFTFVNDAFARTYGYDCEEILDEHVSFIMSDEDVERGNKLIQELLADDERQAATWELEMSTADGDRLPVENHMALLTDDNGTFRGTIGASREISDRKERERELERYETIVEALGDPVYTLDRDGQFTYVNDALCGMCGYEPEGLLGEHASTVIVDEDVKRAETVIQELRDSDDTRASTLEVETVTADGERITTEVHLALLPSEDGEFQGTAGIARDISDRKERERELERYETVIETVGDPICILDDDGRYTYVNEAFVGMVGYDREELVGEHVSLVMPAEDIERGTAAIKDLLTTDGQRTATFEMDTLTADGEHIPTETHIAALPTDGDEYQGVVGVVRDISDRKAREQELKRQNERLDEFASIVSHDLRNPLHVAEARLELAQTECNSPHLDDVADALDRMAELIDDLLTYTKEGMVVDDPSSVDVATIAERAWDTTATEAATLTLDTEQVIEADVSNVRRLFENLISNAVEHGGDDVTVTVGDLEDGFYIADDGPGIPADERDAIFEAGHSTSESGAGLGLAIVRTIAEAHGWEVNVTEGADGGARFEVTGVETAT